MRYEARLPLGGVALAVLATAAAGVACDRHKVVQPPPVRSPALDPDQTAGEAAYLSPPLVAQVRTASDGGLVVRGSAPAQSQVQLASPTGDLVQSRADAKGDWRLRLPPTESPRLFALSAMTAGRTLHAQGALLVAPGALSAAVLLRAGAAALPLVPVDARPDITTVDYDPSGVLAAAGYASSDARVTLAVDGAAAAAGEADAQGRYALVAAGRRLGMGPHRLTVSAAGQAAVRDVSLTPPATLSSPFMALRSAEGWRVEWAPTGGGIQTTLVLGAPGPTAFTPAGSR